ncbi:hypothetical protein HHK36_000091 [Tetracentron sinense]|uniref:Uncharacterized protein n=1 Tax=Tetracentron sinense TaxID=13715 RepID=A0A834ZVB7_TETSI|nr:hypothetical protein HHK36_000091 [Tetracentron sinense]
MEALNAVGLNPVSVLSEPRKSFSLPSSFPLKFPKSANSKAFPPNLSEVSSRSVNGGLVILSSVLSGGLARALTYEEALEQFTSKGSSDFDVGGFVDSAVNFGIENPAIIVGVASILAVPLVLSQILRKPKPWGVESAKNAYTKLADDGEAQLLDIRFDGSSEVVAELNSELPWILPKRMLSFDFGDLKDAIGGALEEGSDGLPVTLGIVAATGLGLLAFSEIETALQLLGSAALIQFVSKKLLFAEDRKETLQQVNEFLNTKVAPKELVDEIKEIGKALIPSSVEGKTLPAVTEGNTNTTVPDTLVQKAQAVLESNVEPKVEAAAEPTPEINLVPKTEYADFKPPTSPSPSKP